MLGTSIHRCCGLISHQFKSISVSSLRPLSRLFSETACQKTEKEMMSAFQEMQQAESLVKRGAYLEADQLYSRVNDIVSSFSPANGPMVDVINRKKLEVYFHSNPSLLFSTMKTMKSNVESRGDKEETILECLQFASLCLYQGKTSESSTYMNSLSSLCGGDNSLPSFVSKLLQTLQQHLTGGENIYKECLKLKESAASHGHFWKLIAMNNALGMMWESECDVSEGLEVSTGVMEAVKEMEAANEITIKNSDMIRQTLNNAGSYLLAHDKVPEGGEALKYALKLSDAQQININQNMVSSYTLGMMGSILLKEDQPVTCEGMYLQALEAYQKKEKAHSLKSFSRPELFDYSTMCQGYSHLLVKWDKRESLGETYQQKATDLLMKVSEGADWEIPLSNRYWIPSPFKWDLDY